MADVTPNFALRFPWIDEVITDASTKNLADDVAGVLTSTLDVARTLAKTRASAMGSRNLTSQSVTANTETTISMDNEFFDTDGLINIGTNATRITIPASMGGAYYVHAECDLMIGSVWSSGQISITKNGTAWVRRKYWAASGQQMRNMQVSGICSLVPTDFLTMTILFQGTPSPTSVQVVRLAGQRLSS
jgi:hypothetical protein